MRRPLRPPVSMNMTPMIDVVFLLIIFFLVSSHLARQEVQLDLNLPTARTGHEPAESDVQRVTINLRADGQVLLGADATDPVKLAERLKYHREHSQRPVEVRLRGDRAVPFSVVEPVLVACAKAQVWNVTFAVVEAE